MSDIIHPTWTFPLPYLLDDSSNLRDLTVEDYVRKRPYQ